MGLRDRTTNDPLDTPVVAAYVGRGHPTDPEGWVRIERVESDFVADYAAYADCVVCAVPGGGLSALESLSEAAVPAILYDRTDDPAVAEAAARLDPAEYVTGGNPDPEGRSLADLIVRVCRRTRGDPPTIHTGSTGGSELGLSSAVGTVERLLDLGRDRLGLEIGAVALTDGVDYTVVAGDDVAAADHSLSGTICRATVRTDGPLELPDTVWGPPTEGLAAPFVRLRSYIGDDFAVDGDRRGTVWFGSERSRSAFTTEERDFLRLLVGLVRAEIGRTRAFTTGSDPESGSAVGAVIGDGGARSDPATPSPGGDDGVSTGSGSAASGQNAPGPTGGDRFRRLFDRLPDAVADVEFRDGVPIVRGVNGAFEETFGREESAVAGRPVSELIVPDGQATAGRLDERAIREGYRTAEVERETADGRRTFLFRGFTYRRGGTDRGFGIYTDITDRLEQERRLRVLHRVLRHNLRNEMTAIIGYADLLAEEGATPECRALGQRIYEEATDVSKLGEQVRRIKQALDVDRKRVAIDPEPIVESIAERFRRQHPDATIRVSAEATAEVVADELLETAIENLLENAIEHHPGDPTVDIEMSPADGGRFDITVSDDGTGIPERERAVVSGDREITQLDHSRGLGLWVSQWVVRGVDGQLRFGDPETGAEVTLRLHRAGGSTSE
jgi:PAS domain S-box-containing protein